MRGWWATLDSNQWPLACQALPPERCAMSVVGRARHLSYAVTVSAGRAPSNRSPESHASSETSLCDRNECDPVQLRELEGSSLKGSGGAQTRCTTGNPLSGLVVRAGQTRRRNRAAWDETKGGESTTRHTLEPDGAIARPERAWIDYRTPFSVLGRPNPVPRAPSDSCRRRSIVVHSRRPTSPAVTGFIKNSLFRLKQFLSSRLAGCWSGSPARQLRS